MSSEPPVVAKGAKLSEDQKKKLEQDYRFVEIPARDVYDYDFEGFWINGLHLKPGKHLLAPDWADEAERILASWQTGQIRLMRPTPHRKSMNEADSYGAVTGAPQ